MAAASRPSRTVAVFSGPAGWRILDAGNAPPRFSTDLPLEPTTVTVVLPPAAVLFAPLPAISARGSRRQQAVEFAVEEWLAGPLEDEHVAFDGRQARVVRRRTVADAVAALPIAMKVERIVAFADLIEPVPGAVVLAAVDPEHPTDGWVARLPDGMALALTPAEAGQLLPGLLTELKRLELIGLGVDAIEPLGLAPNIEVVVRAGDLAAWLAGAVAGARGIDLRLAGMRLAEQAWSPRGLLAAAVLAFAALLSFVVVDRLAIGRLEQEMTGQRERMSALLKQADPTITRVVDPAAQLAGVAARRSGVGGADALQRLRLVAGRLAQSGLTVERIDAQTDRIRLEAVGANIATVEALLKALAADGANPSLVDATPRQGQIAATIEVQF